MGILLESFNIEVWGKGFMLLLEFWDFGVFKVRDLFLFFLVI